MTASHQPSFLYRNRFVFGYIALLIAFFALLIFLPGIAPHGLHNGEMQSVVSAGKVDRHFIRNGQIVNLPYHALQKATIALFGLNLLSVKLPSVIFGVLSALFIVLLINRWFKSDVALLGSCLAVLSTAFLFLATSGTPAVMYLFWLSLILWLGSKIVGDNHVHPFLVILFLTVIAISLYTPHLCYVALVIAIAGLIHPHLRFAIKRLKLWQGILSAGLFALIVFPVLAGCIACPAVIADLCFMQNPGVDTFLQNISTAFTPFFSFSMTYDSIYLTPLFGLGTIALIFIGIIATVNELFTSRSTVVDLLLIFAIIFSGFNPELAITVIVPIAILCSAGIESIFHKWHSLFPENPYAHFLGTLPVLAVVLLIIASGLLHAVNGYHYTPNVAKNFNADIELLARLEPGSVLIIDPADENREFYKLFERYNSITVAETVPQRFTHRVVLLGQTIKHPQLQLKQIITSPKSRNSDRLYIYEKTEPADQTSANQDIDTEQTTAPEN